MSTRVGWRNREARDPVNHRVVILGAGGHARVLLASLANNGIRPVGCIAKSRPEPPWPADIAYIGDDTALDALDPSETLLINGVGSVGSSAVRRRVFEIAKEKRFIVLAVTHPRALVASEVTLCEGAQVMAGAIIQPGCSIGANTIINTGAIIDHDCTIGPHCHIAPGATLSGGVTTGPGVHIGTGAAVIQNIQIGAGAVVGAGSTIVRDVVANTIVVGTPERVKARGANP